MISANSSSNAAGSDATAESFAAWLGTDFGHRVLAEERTHLHAAARRFHGDSVLWVGCTPALLDTTARCMVRERYYATICPQRADSDAPAAAATQQPKCDYRAIAVHPAQLPFASASIDGLVLHHALEASEDQRATLHEAVRVLNAGGRLLLIGVNPASLYLLAKARPALRRLRAVSVPRLYDWLALLGLQRDAKTVYLNYRAALQLDFQGHWWMQASGWMKRLQAPVGGIYLIAATKVGHGLIAKRHQERHSERALVAPLPEPAVRQAAKAAIAPAHGLPGTGSVSV